MSNFVKGIKNTGIFTQEFANSNNAETNIMQAVCNVDSSDKIFVNWIILESTEQIDLDDKFQKEACDKLMKKICTWEEAMGYYLWSY